MDVRGASGGGSGPRVFTMTERSGPLMPIIESHAACRLPSKSAGLR